jgi:hypothetical protein
MVRNSSKPFKYQNQNHRRICCALILFAFLLTPINIYASEISNSEVKASWISTLIDWLNWKDSRKNEKSIICTIGRDKVYMYLKRMEVIKGKKAGKQFLVHNKSTVDDFRECSIVYVSDSEQEYYMNILEKINNAAGIVTVSSIDGFARHGGSIEFVIKHKAKLILNLKVIKNAKVIVDEELYGWVETIPN